MISTSAETHRNLRVQIISLLDSSKKKKVSSENAGPGSRGAGSRGARVRGHGVWKTRGPVENAGSGGRRGVWWKTPSLVGNAGSGGKRGV